MKMKMTNIDSFSDTATTWLKHICLKKDFVGFVNSKDRDIVCMTLHDRTVKDLDIIINKEMVEIGIAMASFPYREECE